MINTILVEDDSYMQKHFSAILGSDERFASRGRLETPLRSKAAAGQT